MIRVTIELVPFGNELQKEKLAEINIANTGNMDEKGDYIYNFDAQGKQSHTKGTVHHNRTTHVYYLIKKIFKKIT